MKTAAVMLNMFRMPLNILWGMQPVKFRMKHQLIFPWCM